MVEFPAGDAVLAEVNGEPGALLYRDDQLHTVLTIELDEAGRIAGLYLVLNPDKLP